MTLLPPPADLRVNAEERPATPPPLFLPWQPDRQIVWDATSLRTLQECAAKYHMKHVDGWMAPDISMDLEFGQAIGAGLETFYREIIENATDHDTALRRAIRAVLSATWDDVANLPRMGRFVRVWRCLGLEKYKNEKGNWARCPYSHKGKHYPAPRPSPCSCGSTTAEAWRWFPFHAAKDRVQLIRALVWYAEEAKTGALRPISLGSVVERAPENAPEVVKHTAAVELPFLVPFTQIGGVQYWLCGWWDAVKQLGGPDGPAFVTDYKTTRHTLSSDYWAGWQPNTQVDLYDLVASKFAPIPVEGVAIEAIQVGCDRNGEGWVRFGYRNYTRTPGQRLEVAREIMTYLGMAASYAQVGYWPMNRASCKLCEFKAVCNLPAEQRPHYLAEHFVRGRWNPLTRTVERPAPEPPRTFDRASPPLSELPQRARDNGSHLRAPLKLVSSENPPTDGSPT